MTQIKRSAGQSAVASAAYRSGERLYSEYYGEVSDYTRKGGVVCSEILLPDHAPPEYADRQTLWNAVEKAESGKKAQLAYSFDIALQNEFSLEENGEWDAKQHREYLVDESGASVLDDAGHRKFNAVPTKIRHGISSPNPESKGPYGWRDSTVVSILKHREYTGSTVNFKTYSNSIWDKKMRRNPVENWAIFPGTHERIIEDDVFEKAQEIRRQRHRKTRTGKSSIFSGLVYCADCGSKMWYCSANNGKTGQEYFDCSAHKKDKESCGGHFIRVSVLEQLVLKHIQAVTGLYPLP